MASLRWRIPASRQCELYTAQLDNGESIWEIRAKRGDVFVNMMGDIDVKVEDKQKVYRTVQEDEIEDDLQKLFIGRVRRLQTLSDSRFHVMGGTGDGKMHIFLTTEFKREMTKKYFWRRVRSFSSKNGGVVGQMARDLENGGVISKHVEVVWRIENMTFNDVKVFIDQARKNSEDIWEEGGMSIS